MNSQKNLNKRQNILLDMMSLPQKLKLFLPKSVDTISLELRWAIPNGFYGKLCPRSGLLREHFVSNDAGVIDVDFRGIIQVLVLNHGL